MLCGVVGRYGIGRYFRLMPQLDADADADALPSVNFVSRPMFSLPLFFSLLRLLMQSSVFSSPLQIKGRVEISVWEG